MKTYAIAPIRLHDVGALTDRELLSRVWRAERGSCYASLVELMQRAIERGLDLDDREPRGLAA